MTEQTEEKVRHVRDAAFWGAPVGTPLPLAKPARGTPVSADEAWRAPSSVSNAYDVLSDDRDYEAFIEKHDQGGGCEDIAAAVEERFGIRQEFGVWVGPDGRREYHSWNEQDDWVLDAAQYVFLDGDGDGVHVYRKPPQYLADEDVQPDAKPLGGFLTGLPIGEMDIPNDGPAPKMIDGRMMFVPRKQNMLDPEPAPEPYPVEWLYRAVSEDELAFIDKHGYMQSDGRMNLIDTEGTVADVYDPRFYLPYRVGQRGRTLKIRYDPRDEWWIDHDGYAKTPAKIPADRIVQATPWHINSVRAEEYTEDRLLFDVFNEAYNLTTRMPDDYSYAEHPYTDFRDALRKVTDDYHDMRYDSLDPLVRHTYTVQEANRLYEQLAGVGEASPLPDVREAIADLIARMGVTRQHMTQAARGVKSALLADLDATVRELKVRHVRDSAFWGAPVGTPLPLPPGYVKPSLPTPPKIEEDDPWAHRPGGPEGGAPLWALDATDVYSSDVYGWEAQRLYGVYGQERMDAQALSTISMMRGNPHRRTKVYRAVPKDDNSPWREGDWVTLTRAYAMEHGRSNLNGDFKIRSKTVPAYQLWTDGNSLQEWGYWPSAPDPGGKSSFGYALRQARKRNPDVDKEEVRAQWLEDVRAFLTPPEPVVPDAKPIPGNKPTPKQIDYALDMLRRADWQDTEYGSFPKPTEAEVRRMSRREVSGLIDILKANDYVRQPGPRRSRGGRLYGGASSTYRGGPDYKPISASWRGVPFDTGDDGDLAYYMQEPDPPKTLYHVAPRSAREQILADGLDATDQTWNTGAGGGDWYEDEWLWTLDEAGEPFRYEYRPTGIYMFSDRQAALDYQQEGDDLYEIDTEANGEELARDPSVARDWDYTDPWNKSYVTRYVEPGALRRVNEDVPEGQGVIPDAIQIVTSDAPIAAPTDRIRRVKTPQEAEKFGAPIGTLLVKDAKTGEMRADDGSPAWIMDENGSALAYTAPHDELVTSAIHKWKASSLDIRRSVAEEAHQMPIGGSGNTKVWRAEARALMDEVESKGLVNTKTLYRGDSFKPTGLMEFTPKRRVARRFADMGGGETTMYPPGTVKAIRVSDYMWGDINAEEDGWIGYIVDDEAPEVVPPLPPYVRPDAKPLNVPVEEPLEKPRRLGRSGRTQIVAELTVDNRTFGVMPNGTYVEECSVCRGTGSRPEYSGIDAGRCWPCAGSGRAAHAGHLSKTYTNKDELLKSVEKARKRRAAAAAKREKERLARFEAGRAEREAEQAAEEAAEQARQAAEEARRNATQHFGQISDEITVSGTVKRVRTVDGYYGPSKLVVVDVDGSEVSMFTTAKWAREMQEGTPVTITGEVRKHGEYNGAKQTTLGRPKLVPRTKAQLVDDLTGILGDLKNVYETKVRHVRDSAFWGAPVGTPLPLAKPARVVVKPDAKPLDVPDPMDVLHRYQAEDMREEIRIAESQIENTNKTVATIREAFRAEWEAYEVTSVARYPSKRITKPSLDDYILAKTGTDVVKMENRNKEQQQVIDQYNDAMTGKGPYPLPSEDEIDSYIDYARLQDDRRRLKEWHAGLDNGTIAAGSNYWEWLKEHPADNTDITALEEAKRQVMRERMKRFGVTLSGSEESVIMSPDDYNALLARSLPPDAYEAFKVSSPEESARIFKRAVQEAIYERISESDEDGTLMRHLVAEIADTDGTLFYVPGPTGPDGPIGPVSYDMLTENGKKEVALSMIRKAVNNWANSSGNDHPECVAMQLVALLEFGLNPDRTYVPDPNPKYNATDAVQQNMARGTKGRRAFLRAMYDLTQEWLEQQGIEAVVCMRGFGHAHWEGSAREDQIHEVAQQPMSSWAVADRDTARTFGPNILMSIIPREKILSTPRTGFGCLSEHEIVTIADVLPAEVV